MKSRGRCIVVVVLCAGLYFSLYSTKVVSNGGEHRGREILDTQALVTSQPAARKPAVQGPPIAPNPTNSVFLVSTAPNVSLTSSASDQSLKTEKPQLFDQLNENAVGPWPPSEAEIEQWYPNITVQREMSKETGRWMTMEVTAGFPQGVQPRPFPPPCFVVVRDYVLVSTGHEHMKRRYCGLDFYLQRKNCEGPKIAMTVIDKGLHAPFERWGIHHAFHGLFGPEGVQQTSFVALLARYIARKFDDSNSTIPVEDFYNVERIEQTELVVFRSLTYTAKRSALPDFLNQLWSGGMAPSYGNLLGCTDMSVVAENFKFPIVVWSPTWTVPNASHRKQCGYTESPPMLEAEAPGLYVLHRRLYHTLLRQFGETPTASKYGKFLYIFRPYEQQEFRCRGMHEEYEKKLLDLISKLPSTVSKTYREVQSGKVAKMMPSTNETESGLLGKPDKVSFLPGMSVQEQYHRVRAAQVIIAAEGAAFSWTLASRPGTTWVMVLEHYKRAGHFQENWYFNPFPERLRTIRLIVFVVDHETPGSYKLLREALLKPWKNELIIIAPDHVDAMKRYRKRHPDLPPTHSRLDPTGS